MNILITGATGFLGSRLVEDFFQRDTIHHIVATGRKPVAERMIDSPKVSYVFGDLTDEYFFSTLFDQNSIDMVINCASLSSPWGRYEQFYQANCVTQKHMIQYSKQYGILRFIYISSPTIYFNYQHAIDLKEEAPLPKKFVNHYATTKKRAEDMLCASGLEYIIIRPRAIIGRGDSVIMPRLLRSYQEGRLKILGDGKNVVDMTPVSNLTEAIHCAVMADKTACNTDYNISNGEGVVLWDMINLVLRLMGLKAISKKVPLGILMIVASMMEWKSRWFSPDQEPTLTRYTVGVLAMHCTFSIDKAKKLLGYQPKQSIPEAIHEFAEWYKQKEHDVTKV
ncbi:NAD-dependent epimerase/dehydratase family protein [Algivirga pacifica]|uniref:NAD(P)-dependent oxidoreductase n=1 Tax=Algivirga pacifica TaxID=1162670 RepID=A0ABP9DMX3_9BACT